MRKTEQVDHFRVPEHMIFLSGYLDAVGRSLTTDDELWTLTAGDVKGHLEGDFQSPKSIGTTTARVEMFVDDPIPVITRAVEAGPTGGDIRDHAAPWGTHRQGGFIGPFGNVWLVGDKSPLRYFRR